MKLLYRRYRCLVENGWWYTWHKVLWVLFGTLDPACDPLWPQKREEFWQRHPERRAAALQHDCSASVLDDSETAYEKAYRDKADILCLKRMGERLTNDPDFTDSMRRVYYPDNFHWDMEKKCRDILFVSHELSLSGAPWALYQAVKASAEEGDFCVVITPIDGPLKQKFLDLGVIVIVDKEQNRMFKRFACSFDLVVVNTLASVWAVRLLENDIVPVMWWIHEGTTALDCFREMLPSKVGDNVFTFFVGEYAKRICGEVLANKNNQEILFYPVEKKETKENVLTAENNDKVVFLICGSISKRKGQDLLLEAIERMSQDYRERAHFYIIGSSIDDELLSGIKKAQTVFNNIELLPSMEKEKLEQYYDMQDCMIMPSRDDPFPMTCMESMAKGKPVIVSSNTGTADVLTDGLDGFVFESCNIEQLTQKIEYAIDHKEELAKIGERAFHVYEKYCNMDNFRKSYYSAVDTLIKLTL